MGKVQTSQIKVNKTTVKRKGNSDSKSSKKSKNTYCILCRSSHLKYDAQEHIHSMLHHRELEAMLGKDSSHECQACRASSMGLFQYAQHISTAQHKAKLKSLISKHVKPISLHKTLSKETIGRILERNKTLKKEERKQWRKKRKKLKQIAGQNRAEMQHRALQKNLVASRVLKLELSKQANRRTLTPMQGTHQKGSDNAVVQNKENKVSSLQRHLHQRETTLAGRTWQQACVPGQFNEPNHQMRCDDNFSANNQCISVEMQHSKTGRRVKRPNSTQEGVATDMTEQISWSAISQYDYYNRQDKGAIIIDEGQNECCGPSQPGQDGSYVSSNPASAHKSVSAAPIQDVDVNSRLRQIRRALGVREPCRADREARRQNSEAGVRLTDRSTTQQSGAERERPSGASTSSVQSLLVSTPASAAHSGVCLSNIAPTKERRTTFKMTQESAQHWEKRSVVADGLSNSKGKTTSTEPHLNKGHKVRIAHKPGKIHGGKEVGLKPTLNKLRTLSGAKSKLSWMEMYNEMKSNGQDKVKGMPRFGIELANSPTNRSTQPQDSDLPLSQGFHWESIPDSPSGPHSTSSPPPWDTMGTDSHREVQADSKMQEPSTARQGGRGHSPTPASVKAEINFEDENGGLRDNSSASKRKHNTDDTISNKEPSEKKKRPKSSKDQDQMPQLLAVSLREDELSHSLQDLDKSLVQARNALHAAYTEVQRLLLLRQQFTAEVNNLRAKRIEILQEMQEGYSGASNEAEKAATSLAGAAVGAAAVQPRHSPLPSPSAFSTFSIHQTPATASPSSITQPHPAPLPLSASSEKLEICRQAGEGQGGQFLSSNTNAPYVPLNQPVPLFPSDHFPPLLLRPSNLAAPAAVATAASTSVNTLLSPESSSARQQERQTWEGRVETKRLAKEKAQPVESDSEEESGGNPVQEQVKGRQWAAEKPVPRRGQNAAVVDLDDGSESDDSVKMIEPSKLEVIDIDESDNEAAPEAVSDVSVEFISASTQTFQQNEEDRKIRSSLPVRHSRAPKESVDDEEPSLGAFGNHSGPIHGLQVHEGLLYTCSADNTVRAYSLMNRECQAVFEGHTNKVNCLLVCSLPSMPTRLYTGSSDQSIRCYSIRSKKCLEQISLPDRVLCLHIAWNTLYAGLANGSVASYDLRTLKQLDVFECHGPRGVSCLGTVQEGARRVLLVGSYDSTISVRDAKSGLLLRSLEGHTKTVLCMKVVNDLVFSSSSDTSVHAHNIHTGELVRIYKGHGHAVTSIVILGKVMVTACLDKLIRIYELQSHDRLQVYGGHSDMVMCMTVHRNVIYTGCYDGSVQAVKLNLRKNYRCWWQNCSLIFGIAEHLVQHLVGDHSNPKLHKVKCRWRGCYTFFATQQAVGQELPKHMQSHVDNDSKVEP